MYLIAHVICFMIPLICVYMKFSSAILFVGCPNKNDISALLLRTNGIHASELRPVLYIPATMLAYQSINACTHSLYISYISSDVADPLSSLACIESINFKNGLEVLISANICLNISAVIVAGEVASHPNANACWSGVTNCLDNQFDMNAPK